MNQLSPKNKVSIILPTFNSGSYILDCLNSLLHQEYKNIEVDAHVNYRGNRLIVFDAYLPHQAQPVSRECYELRTCVVFKCNISGGNRERLDFYKNTKNDGKLK